MTPCKRGGNQRSVCRMWFTNISSFSEIFNVELLSSLSGRVYFSQEYQVNLSRKMDFASSLVTKIISFVPVP